MRLVGGDQHVADALEVAEGGGQLLVVAVRLVDLQQRVVDVDARLVALTHLEELDGRRQRLLEPLLRKDGRVEEALVAGRLLAGQARLGGHVGEDRRKLGSRGGHAEARAPQVEAGDDEGGDGELALRHLLQVALLAVEAREVLQPGHAQVRRVDVADRHLVREVGRRLGVECELRDLCTVMDDLEEAARQVLHLGAQRLALELALGQQRHVLERALQRLEAARLAAQARHRNGRLHLNAREVAAQGVVALHQQVEQRARLRASDGVDRVCEAQQLVAEQRAGRGAVVRKEDLGHARHEAAQAHEEAREEGHRLPRRQQRAQQAEHRLRQPAALSRQLCRVVLHEQLQRVQRGQAGGAHRGGLIEGVHGHRQQLQEGEMALLRVGRPPAPQQQVGVAAAQHVQQAGRPLAPLRRRRLLQRLHVRHGGEQQRKVHARHRRLRRGVRQRGVHLVPRQHLAQRRHRVRPPLRRPCARRRHLVQQQPRQEVPLPKVRVRGGDGREGHGLWQAQLDVTGMRA
mmetsp:Transcript_29/g.103  ORF Transcript_29/g.103 Transcript_29/m.103 type:complete len:517 (+) Transcript_29:880-2430(+)